MHGRKLGVLAFFILMVGMIGPSALAGDNHSDVFTFTTSSTGSRVITIHTAPTFAASNVLSGSGSVATTAPAATSVTELAVTGANWTVTAQLCGPASQSTITETAALTAGSDCTGANGNQFAGYNTSTGAFQTTIAGSRVTAASTITNAGTAVPPFLAGTASTTASSAMSAPVTILNAGSSESANKSYSATYAVTTDLTVANVNDNATWVGYWVTTLQP
jgi:hypothetical protein